MIQLMVAYYIASLIIDGDQIYFDWLCINNSFRQPDVESVRLILIENGAIFCFEVNYPSCYNNNNLIELVQEVVALF